MKKRIDVTEEHIMDILANKFTLKREPIDEEIDRLLALNRKLDKLLMQEKERAAAIKSGNIWSGCSEKPITAHPKIPFMTKSNAKTVLAMPGGFSKKEVEAAKYYLGMAYNKSLFEDGK